jgi:hypothetical protein
MVDAFFPLKSVKIQVDDKPFINGRIKQLIQKRVACEQALKVKWEPTSMTNAFEYLRLKSWREILIGQML